MGDAMLSAIDLSYYLIEQFVRSKGRSISNLKLQKLLFYAQAHYLGLYGEPLFKENIEAWKHGPVINIVYHEFKRYGNKLIPFTKESNQALFTDEQLAFIDFICDEYGKYSAITLYKMVHNDKSYKRLYKPGVKRIVIPKKELKKNFYNTVVIDEKQFEKRILSDIKKLDKTKAKTFTYTEALRHFGLAN